MKIFRILLLTSALALLASCQGPVKPENTDGHQLWFYSMDKDGMNLSPEKTTMAIAANEIQEYWKGSQAVSFNVLETKDETLGSEGYRLVFGKDGIKLCLLFGKLCIYCFGAFRICLKLCLEGGSFSGVSLFCRLDSVNVASRSGANSLSLEVDGTAGNVVKTDDASAGCGLAAA